VRGPGKQEGTKPAVHRGHTQRLQGGGMPLVPRVCLQRRSQGVREDQGERGRP